MDHMAGTAAPAWQLWLQDGVVGQAMRQSLYLFPAVEILHIIGFATLFGCILAMDARLLGAAQFLPADRLARHLLPWAAGGFALAVPTGLLLFTTEAVAIAANPAFRVKLILIALAGVNAAVLHLGAWRRIADWTLDRPPPAARVGAALSILFWLGIIAGGRLIAYF